MPRFSFFKTRAIRAATEIARISVVDSVATLAINTVPEIETNVSNLDSSVTTIQTDLTTINSEVDTLESNISTISSSITTIQGQIPTSVDDLTDVDITSVTPQLGQALVYDGTKFTPGDVATSGGGAQQKTYSYIGPLQENVSTERLYIGEASTLSKILTVVGSTGNTSAQIKIKKNGTVINTITIPADTSTVSTTTNTALAEGDYLTVDITGSSSAKDLYVTLIYGAE
jgi:hypothetical protein